MQTDRTRKYLIVAAIALVVIILDQYTKHLIIRSFALHQSLDVIQNYATIVHTRNRGIAFGIFAAQGSGTQTILLIITSCLAISFIFYLVSQCLCVFAVNIIHHETFTLFSASSDFYHDDHAHHYHSGHDVF